MASNTLNLDLSKKDPVTDGNDTFNIQTMLNDNWDKIDEAVGQLQYDIQNIDISPASLTQAGIVQLSNAVNSTSETMASTLKAVKTAYDAAAAAQLTANAANTTATAAKQAGNERKAELVAALVAKGIAATTSETWAQLLDKVTSLIKATGNAIADDLLSGKTASNNNGPITGTMPNRSGSNSAAGWADGVTTVGRLFLRPQAGYWDGTKFTYADDNNYIATNFAKDVTVFGLRRALERMITVEKQAFADAITGKGIAASIGDSNIVLAQKIGQIVTGKKFATGTTLPTNGFVIVTGLTFVPKIVLFRANFADGSKSVGMCAHKDVVGEVLGAVSGYTSDGLMGSNPTFTNNGFTTSVFYNKSGSVSWLALEW